DGDDPAFVAVGALHADEGCDGKRAASIATGAEHHATGLPGAAIDVGPRRLARHGEGVGGPGGGGAEAPGLRLGGERRQRPAIGKERLVQVSDAGEEPIASEEPGLLVDDEIGGELDAEAAEEAGDGGWRSRVAEEKERPAGCHVAGEGVDLGGEELV